MIARPGHYRSQLLTGTGFLLRRINFLLGSPLVLATSTFFLGSTAWTNHSVSDVANLQKLANYCSVFH